MREIAKDKASKRRLHVAADEDEGKEIRWVSDLTPFTCIH